jgi:hypothetical protein
VKGMPFVHVMPRVSKDCRDCIAFVARQSWGDPAARRRDIERVCDDIVERPEAAPVHLRRPSVGLELRCRTAAQFVVIYAYVPPGPRFPNGCVSLRAIRHRRVRNVFSGVREQSEGRIREEVAIAEPETKHAVLKRTACIGGRVSRPAQSGPERDFT